MKNKLKIKLKKFYFFSPAIIQGLNLYMIRKHAIFNLNKLIKLLK